MPNQFIANHRELLMYQIAFEAAMQVFELAQTLPDSERKLLTYPMVRASRSVCANLAKAWQKRRYRSAFIAKLNTVESEAAATQTWIEFAILCSYIDAEVGQELLHRYTLVLTTVGRFIDNADAWVVKS